MTNGCKISGPCSDCRTLFFYNVLCELAYLPAQGKDAETNYELLASLMNLGVLLVQMKAEYRYAD
jgi:hypothetical protein